VKFIAIEEWAKDYPTVLLCRELNVKPNSYYAWKRRPGKLISAADLHLYRRVKTLFNESRQSMGKVTMSEALKAEGLKVGKYRAKSLMQHLGLKVVQRQAYKVTTEPNAAAAIASNVLNQQFDPSQINKVWVSDITYLRTSEGWLYLAVVMDCCSRKVVGWAMNKRMTQGLVIRALMKAIALRNPPSGLIHHSDRGSQYTSKRYQKLLKQQGMISSMSGKGCCYDNAVMERFFGSLKHEWLALVSHKTRYSMTNDVNAYVRYYNGKRLHSTLKYKTPNDYENSLIQVVI